MPAADTPATIQGVRSRGGGDSCRPLGPATPSPHEEQNRSPATTGAPQDAHRPPPRGAPHEEQKLPLPAAPQAAQVVTPGSDTMGMQSFREA
jgi:hypothetical protein